MPSLPKTPEQFGAVGDGLADDTVPVQACLDQYGTLLTGANKALQKIRFTAGATYKLTSTLKVRQAYLRIDGEYAALYNTGGGSALFVTPELAPNHLLGVQIKDLHIYGSGSGSGSGILAEFVPQLDIRGVFIKPGPFGSSAVSVPSHGIVLGGSVAGNITNCRIDACGGIGIYVRAAQRTLANGTVQIAESQAVSCLDNRIYNAGSIGMLLSEGGGMKAYRNDIEGCKAGGIAVRSSYDFSVVDNYFEVNGGFDIDTRNLTHLVPARSIQGGRIWGNQSESQYAVLVNNGAGTHVQSNRLSGASVINPGASNTVWGKQVTQGSLSNNGVNTIFS